VISLVLCSRSSFILSSGTPSVHHFGGCRSFSS